MPPARNVNGGPPTYRYPPFPETSGRDYELSPYLQDLAESRNDFTVISGLWHPDVDGGHSTENCFLTAARGPTKSGFRNTISLDQFAVERLGPVTRFPTLNLGVNIDKANRSPSRTRDGVPLPAEYSASALFRKMFVQGDQSAVQRQLHKLDERASILDTLLDDTLQFQKHSVTMINRVSISTSLPYERSNSVWMWRGKPTFAVRFPAMKIRYGFQNSLNMTSGNSRRRIYPGEIIPGETRDLSDRLAL